MQALKEGTWHVEMGSCMDDDKGATVYYWSIRNISGDNGLTQDGIEMASADNYDSEEIAKRKWQEFATTNGIKNLYIEERFRG